MTVEQEIAADLAAMRAGLAEQKKKHPAAAAANEKSWKALCKGEYTHGKHNTYCETQAVLFRIVDAIRAYEKRIRRLESGEELADKLEESERREQAAQQRKETRMAATPDPKPGAASKAGAKPKTGAVKAPKVKATFPDEIQKEIVKRVKAGEKYSVIEKDLIARKIAPPTGYKSIYNAVRDAAVAHFGSVEKARDAAGKVKEAA